MVRHRIRSKTSTRVLQWSALSFFILGLASDSVSASLIYERWEGINGVLVSDLRNNPAFPLSPSFVGTVELAEIPQDSFDNYGARLSGLITPDLTGNYDFFMSSDDQGELWLSTDVNPANLVLIAREPQYNASRDYVSTDRRDAAAPENRSTRLFPGGIPLTAGQSYYVEALMKEGPGGDNLSFTAALHGDPVPTVPLGPVAQGGAGGFRLSADGVPAVPEPSSVVVWVVIGLTALLATGPRQMFRTMCQ